jgi:7,8-didemethyl-8-hydroxy-5-deazariboflavin synthase CofG subunit
VQGRVRHPVILPILDAGEVDGHRFVSMPLVENARTLDEAALARYGHLQEVIVQNFRVKPAIPMASWPEPSRGEMLRTVAVARLVLREMNIQAPPNLSSPGYDVLLSAGINDWGGVSPLTPDFINPEAPWPHLDELQRRTEAAGYELRPRLPVYPGFLPQVLRAAPPLLAARLRDAATPDGFARAA